PDYDRLRPGQQRIRWRTCVVPSNIYEAFDAMTPSFDPVSGNVFAQAGTSHQGNDDVHGFGVNACTGQLAWASSSVGTGKYDGAVASGMLFQMSSRPDLQVLNGADGTVLATIPLTS